MVEDIMLIVRPQDERDKDLLTTKAMRALSQKGIRADRNDVALVLVKKSIDARHGNVKLNLKYRAYIGERPDAASAKNVEGAELPHWKRADEKSVLVIGSGPAGLFGALALLEHGIKPIVIERGAETAQRKKDIAEISAGSVNADSNFCFGEGGAGTFSDGKLYTRSDKRGNAPRILRIFKEFGADESILTDARPHIGTDKLPKIVNAMREKIVELGGEFYFDTRCVDFIFDDETDETKIASRAERASGEEPAGAAELGTKLAYEAHANITDDAKNAVRRVVGVRTKNVTTGEARDFYADAVLLAAGHSVRDIYELLAKCAPDALSAKAFAVGVRVEHPRELIDKIQYHGKMQTGLPAAEYKLAAQIDGRGVYSFCVCPGGFVVPSATSGDEIVVNGMSASERNSKWSNAAIVVETRTEDIPQGFVKEAEAAGCAALAPLYWRTWLERLAKKNGAGQKAPAQRMRDFLARKKSAELPDTSYAPGVVSSRLDAWLPDWIAKRLAKAFVQFNKSMKGFISTDALLIAVETRTSTPVRILRDKETCECVALKNLYPAGEGSGWSGGIVSSAMDGEKVCAAIAREIG